MKFLSLKSSMILSFIQNFKFSHCSAEEQKKEPFKAFNHDNNEVNLKDISQMIKRVNLEELESFLNGNQNVLKALIEDHFKEAKVDTSKSYEINYPKSDEPSNLCSMIKEFYPVEYFSKELINSFSRDQEVLKDIWGKSLEADKELAQKFENILDETHGCFMLLGKSTRCFGGEIIKKIFSLFGDKLKMCNIDSEDLTFYSKIHLIIKVIEIFKLF